MFRRRRKPADTVLGIHAPTPRVPLSTIHRAVWRYGLPFVAIMMSIDLVIWAVR